MSRGFFMPKSFRNLLSGTDGMLLSSLLSCRGVLWGLVVWVLSANKLTMKGLTTMNTMINPEPQPTREALLARVEELETRIEVLDAEIAGKSTVLKMADESLQSYKQQIANYKESVEALAHEHIDLEGTGFFDEIVELFDIELTKFITLQFSVSIEVQAQVPANMDESDVAEELTNATLDYSFWGNGDIVIEGFDFGEMEAE